MDSLTMASSAVPPHLTCVSTANNQDNVNDNGLEASVGPICESVPVSLHTMDTGGPDDVIQTKPIKPFSPGIPRSSPSALSNEICKQTVGIMNNGIPTFGASPITDETQDRAESEPGIKLSAELSPQFDLNGSHGTCPTVAQSYSSSTVGSSLSLSSVNTSSIMSPAPGNASAVAFNLPPSQTNKSQQQGLRPDLPQPPKKPLSPYMRFSKEIWQKVKADNPGMSVCEVGATIGRIWRELDEARKQLFILEFNNDKARYDTELQGYLRTNGLQASDIIKPRAKKIPKDPTSAKRSKGQNQKNQNHDAQHDLASGTNYHRPTATSQCSASDVQQMNFTGQEQRSQEMSVALPSFSQVWSNPDATTQRDLLAQVVYDSQLHDERDTSEIEGANQGISIFANQGQLATTSLPSVVCKNDQKMQLMKGPAVSQVKTEAGNWWWPVENDRNLGRSAFQQQTGSATAQQQPSAGGSSFPEVAVKTEECLSNKTPEASKSDCGWSEGNSKSAVVGNSWLGQQPVATQRVQSTGEEKGTAIDAEKLFLRGALVEKTQEVVQLMRELDQAYGLIHQLKTQNDFFHRWYQEQRNAPQE